MMSTAAVVHVAVVIVVAPKFGHVIRGLLTSLTKNRMSANKAKQRFVFSRAPDLNSCFSLKAEYPLTVVYIKVQRLISRECSW